MSEKNSQPKDYWPELMIILWFMFVSLILFFSGCGEYHPGIVDIRDGPVNIGFHPELPDTKNFVPPVPPKPGFDYKLAEQRRLNHLVKFQEQLRKQRLRVQ